MIKKVIGIVLMVVVLGALLPVLWPMVEDTAADVSGNLSGTGPGGTFIATMWPIVLLIVGIGVAAGLIFYALKRFGGIGSR